MNRHAKSLLFNISQGQFLLTDYDELHVFCTGKNTSGCYQTALRNNAFKIYLKY